MNSEKNGKKGPRGRIYALILIITIIVLALFAVEKAGVKLSLIPSAYAAELEADPASLREANLILQSHGMTWKSVETAYVDAEGKARTSAYSVFHARTLPQQQLLLAQIEKEFVDPYFSYGGDLYRSLGCIVRLGFCKKFIEKDFEKHFSGIEDEVLLGVWKSATLSSLERYEIVMRMSLQSYFIKKEISDREFQTLLSALPIEPTGAARHYAEREGLFRNRTLESVVKVANFSLFSAEVIATVRELSVEMARRQALSRARQRAARFVASAGAGAAAGKTLLKNAGRATIVIGIVVEVMAAQERKKQKSLMMDEFRSRFVAEEQLYFDAAVAFARDANLDKDIIEASRKVASL
ncbi:MAG: hypothetical protein KDE05_09100 [Parvularculaceae bacterium]|nr:hypothetical protein [Parvularculaceae bacterium]